jgi:thioredoxin reductase (NADPH)
MSARHARVLILGSGPAGYTAAIYAARAMLKPVLVQGIQPGGQLTITTDVENYPGFADVIQGPWLMEQMKAQAEHVGTEVVSDTITEVRLKDKPIWLKGDSGTEYTCDALIICTGAQAKWLELPSEQAFRGFGVSACATCDGFFYRNKRVLVVGGGNTAVEEALFLTNFASEVIVVHRRNEFKAGAHPAEPPLRASQDQGDVGYDPGRCSGYGQSEERHPCPPQEREDGRDGRPSRRRHLHRHRPLARNRTVQGQLPFKQGGYLITEPRSTLTAIPGVYAAGDVTDDVYRQAVTAAGMGCMAALEAERWLHTNTEMRHAAE